MKNNAYFIGMLLLLLTSLSIAGQIKVPQDFSTIQSAIDNANAGDVILVENGTYLENLIIDKPLVLQSVFSESNNPLDIKNTIINGTLSGSVVKAENIIGQVTINGFTIVNGSGSDYEIANNFFVKAGGGIYANIVQHLNIENVIIKDNHLTTDNNMGGGLFAKESSVTIKASTFFNNTTKGENFLGDGGAMILENCQTVVANSIIQNNSSLGYDFGPAIRIKSGNFSISNSQILDNKGTKCTGLVAFAANVTISNSNFTGNNSALLISNKKSSNGVDDENSHSLNILNSNFNLNRKGGRGTVYLFKMNVEIKDSHFDNNDNLNGQNGGAINALFSNIMVENSSINGNISSFLTSANLWYSGEGAGMWLYDCVVVLKDTQISNNSCNSLGPFDLGGGIFCEKTDLEINNCILSNNTANDGGALASFNSSIKIFKTLIYNNAADKGGFCFSANNSFSIISSTITKNASLGSAIYTIHEDKYIFANAILWNENNVEVFKKNDTGISSFTFSHSNIRGFDAFFTGNNQLNKTWLAGNLNTNSFFEDEVNNNFNLSNRSPLINSGTNFLEINSVVLVDLDPSDYFGSAPEIGAFENQNVLAINDENIDNKLIIFNKNETQIGVKMNDGTIIKSFSAYNVLGKKVIGLHPNKNSFTIDTFVKQGTILFINILLEDNQNVRTKFIKI